MLSLEENQKKCDTCPERYHRLAGNCVADGRLDGEKIINQMIVELRTLFEEQFKVLYISRCVYRSFIKAVNRFGFGTKLNTSKANWPTYHGIELRVDDDLRLFDVRVVYSNHEKILQGKMFKKSLTNC